jgi:hypothetical protein
LSTSRTIAAALTSTQRAHGLSMRGLRSAESTHEKSPRAPGDPLPAFAPASAAAGTGLFPFLRRRPTVGHDAHLQILRVALCICLGVLVPVGHSSEDAALIVVVSAENKVVVVPFVTDKSHFHIRVG